MWQEDTYYGEAQASSSLSKYKIQTSLKLTHPMCIP